VTVLSQQTNLGFSGGNNVGMRYAMKLGADYTWLLNNDTVVDPGALSLADAFRDPKVGIAGSKIYFAPGHEYHLSRYTKAEQGKVFWFAGGLIDWNNMYASHRGVDEVDHGQYDKVIETPFVTGCSMMIRRSVIEVIGYLDDRLYLYLEDLDYCLRAKQHDFAITYYPSSVIWHVNAGSSGGAGNELHEYYITRNRLFIGFRYAPVRTKIALLREAVRFALSAPPVTKRAVYDALFGRWGKQYEPKKFT
jgi:GT2 family glycosyltransferase